METGNAVARARIPVAHGHLVRMSGVQPWHVVLLLTGAVVSVVAIGLTIWGLVRNEQLQREAREERKREGVNKNQVQALEERLLSVLSQVEVNTELNQRILRSLAQSGLRYAVA